MYLSRLLHNSACREVDSENLEKAEQLFRDPLSMKRKILGETKYHSSISLTIFASDVFIRGMDAFDNVVAVSAGMHKCRNDTDLSTCVELITSPREA